VREIIMAKDKIKSFENFVSDEQDIYTIKNVFSKVLSKWLKRQSLIDSHRISKYNRQKLKEQYK
jgi:hypothetical protein